MSTDAMRAAALKIVAAYDAYRHRGMAPAPGEYAGVVAAIEEARAALAQPSVKCRAKQVGPDQLVCDCCGPPCTVCASAPTASQENRYEC